MEFKKFINRLERKSKKGDRYICKCPNCGDDMEVKDGSVGALVFCRNCKKSDIVGAMHLSENDLFHDGVGNEYDSETYNIEWLEMVTIQPEGELEVAEAIEPKKKPFLSLQSASNLLEKELEPLRVFVGDDEHPFLVEGTCILSAKPKLGKSWFALALCMAVASGEKFLGYTTNQCSTLYLDLEQVEQLQKKRLAKISGANGVPNCFYIASESQTLNNGFSDQIEEYLKQDPNIGVIVVDVFQKIRTGKKKQETEYETTYNDLAIINKLAKKYHISIILVCHDRKTVDEKDPFSNILGSTGLQGASDQMIVLYKDKYNSPNTHIACKGRTIDDIIEFEISMDDTSTWTKCTPETAEDIKKREYMKDPFRAGIVALMHKYKNVSGHATDIYRMCTENKIALPIEENGEPLREGLKRLGLFLSKYKWQLLEIDHIDATVKKGTKTNRNTYKLMVVNSDEDGFTITQESMF